VSYEGLGKKNETRSRLEVAKKLISGPAKRATSRAAKEVVITKTEMMVIRYVKITKNSLEICTRKNTTNSAVKSTRKSRTKGSKEDTRPDISHKPFRPIGISTDSVSDICEREIRVTII